MVVNLSTTWIKYLNLDLCFQIIRVVAVDFQAAGHFLDPFLTETICEKSSNWDDYMPNR